MKHVCNDYFILWFYSIKLIHQNEDNYKKCIHYRVYQVKSTFNRVNILTIRNMLHSDIGTYKCKGWLKGKGWVEKTFELTYGMSINLTWMKSASLDYLFGWGWVLRPTNTVKVIWRLGGRTQLHLPTLFQARAGTWVEPSMFHKLAG